MVIFDGPTFWHQLKGVLRIEKPQWVGYGEYANIYKADVNFSNQSELLPVQISLKISGVMC
jgi:hypothetical protein